MINARTIHDYLDGTIDPLTEASLFNELASDSDARRELNDQIRLHLAVKKDMSAIAVPHSATATIFSELGYAVPDAAVLPPPATTPWRRRSALLLLLLLCLGAGAFLTRTFWPRVEIAEQATTTATMPTSTASNTPAPAPALPQYGSSVEQPERRTNTPTTVKNVAPAVVDDIPLSTSDRQQATAAPTLSFTPAVHNGSSNAMMTSERLMLSADRNTVSDASAWHAFAYGLANVASDPFTSADVSGGSAFAQFQVGVTYDLAPEHRLAIKGGRQVMPQEFTRFEDGRDVVYRQTPTLWWAGVMYEHSFTGLRVGDVLEPYAAATAGIMQTGPMGRLGAGFHVFPQQRLSFGLGVEATSMLYPIQSVYYTSTTWSITYGIRYHF